MTINDESMLINDFVKNNPNLETPDDIPVEVLLKKTLSNAGRTLRSLQNVQAGAYAVRSDSTGLAFIIKIPKRKKGEKQPPELLAILPYFNGGKKKASGVKALERQLDFFVRDRLKTANHSVNAAQKSHEVIEFGELKFTYWEGVFYDANVVDMIIIK